MGGREWRGSGIGTQAAGDVFSRVVAVLEDLFTAEEVSRRRDRGPGRPSSGAGIGGRVQ